MTYVKEDSLLAGYASSNAKIEPDNRQNEIRPNNRVRDLESKLRMIRNTKTLDKNIRKVLEFDRECEQNGHSTGTRHSVLNTLHCLCQFAGKKPFERLTKTDILSFLDDMRNRRFEYGENRAKSNHLYTKKQLANSTMNMVKLRVKRFYQWLHSMEKGRYPENVRWIELKTIKGDRELTPEELPTAGEVRQMIECTENPRDRALVSMMAESGARIGEISTIQLKDVRWNENGFVLTIRSWHSKSKLGRRIPLCACVEDVKRWVNDYHPFKNDPEAPLFVSFAARSAPKDNLKTTSIHGLIRALATRTGLDKRIRMYPHKFRHFRASQMAELGWNEPMLRQFFGWTKTSKMPSVYIHMSQKSMVNQYYRMYGKGSTEEPDEKILREPETCSRCGARNPSGYRFCFRCNTVLNKEEQKQITDKKEVENTLNFIAGNPELSERFSRLLQEAVEKQKYERLASTPVSG